MTKQLPSPLKRLGGKANLSPWIVHHLPKHETYIEVFGGSAPVLLRKHRPKGQEVYNDLDGLWTNTWKCLRDQNAILAELIHGTPYGRAEFFEARDAIYAWKHGERQIAPLELARMHLVVVRQSFSADGRSWSTSSTGGENRPRLWARLPNAIRRCLDRLRGVYIECRDYHYILERYDHERATFYLDPPYEGVEDKYYEANKDSGFDHTELRNAVEDIKGSVVVSYYKRQGIEDLYKDWTRETKDVIVHAGDVKRMETELLFIRKSKFGCNSRRTRGYDMFADG